MNEQPLPVLLLIQCHSTFQLQFEVSALFLRQTHVQIAKLVDYDSKRNMYFVEYTVQARFFMSISCCVPEANMENED